MTLDPKQAASRIALALCLLALAGCGAPDPSESGPVSTRINGSESDVRQAGRVYKSTNISTSSGNAWGDFVKRAKEACGADPAGFEFVSASVSNTSPFEDFVKGELALVLSHSTSGGIPTAPSADLARADGPTGRGPATLAVTATRATLVPLHARLVGGDFEVVLRAATDKTDRDDFRFDLTVTLGARAFCE